MPAGASVISALQALSREEKTSDIASLAAAISMTLLDGREVELP